MPVAAPSGALLSRRVLLIGETGCDELSPIAQWLGEESFAQGFALEKVGAAGSLKSFDTDAPDLLVVLQRWPDEFTAAEVTELLARWPLARRICVYGPWCDSDGQTRRRWPVALRVPATEGVDRLRRELRELAALRAPPAVTASRTEVFAARYLACSEDRPDRGAVAAPPGATKKHGESERSSPRPLLGTRVRIVSPDRGYAEAVADLVQAGGGVIIPPRVDDEPSPPVDVLLWDADPLPPPEDGAGRSRLRAAIDRHCGNGSATGVVLLVGFPRRADITTLGGDARFRVVAKLASAESLWNAIADARRKSHEGRPETCSPAVGDSCSH